MAGKISIGIVVSKFNVEITSSMVAEAVRLANLKGAKVASVIEVPGAYEVPFASDLLLSKKNIDAVAAVGAVIKGGTKHDEAILNAVCISLSAISLRHKKPIGMGIIGPGASYQQAKARAKEYSRRAVEAALWMANLKV